MKAQVLSISACQGTCPLATYSPLFGWECNHPDGDQQITDEEIGDDGVPWFCPLKKAPFLIQFGQNDRTEPEE